MTITLPRLNSKLRPARKALIIILTICATLTTIGRADANIIDPLPRVSGTIMAVTEDGIMLVSRSGERDDDIIKIRGWARVVDAPARLGMLTLGRKISCWVLLEIEGVIIGDCIIKFSQSRMLHSSEKLKPNAFSLAGMPLGTLLGRFNIAHIDCNPAYLRNIPKIPIQIEVRRKSCERVERKRLELENKAK